ncbi:zinc finger protein 77-like [Bombyx mandarina]|uniref:Zinc finger protein 77-like n=1 Tax=Bombyx mandarina TaxID=7092 RepID=A0A6J2KFC4_BOMMA|nr:zinc finger protein 77-like [Bombyx mandarina]
MEDINEKTCRICFQTKEVVFPLFEKQAGSDVSHYERLVKKTKLQIEVDDIGPTSICSECLTELDTTVTFLEKCERSNRVLAATYVRGFNDYSNFRFETTGVEYIEYRVVETPEESSTPRGEEQSEEPVGGLRRHVSSCSQCGSKRRCRHRAQSSHTCQFCSKVFTRKFNFLLHVKRHLGQRDWTCPGCGALQLTRWHAERHCKPKTRHVCSVLGCGKMFTTKTNLNIHVRTHNGERPFECSHCKKTFTSKNTLKDHIRIHTGEKPYMCPVCGQQFATNKLSSHMWRHRRPGLRPRAPRAPPPAPVACLYCGAKYHHRQSLNKHVKKQHQQKPATQTDAAGGEGAGAGAGAGGGASCSRAHPGLSTSAAAAEN